MVYGTYNKLVTGANLNQRSHHNGGPHIVPSSVIIAIAGKVPERNERNEKWEIHSMNFKLITRGYPEGIVWPKPMGIPMRK